VRQLQHRHQEVRRRLVTTTLKRTGGKAAYRLPVSEHDPEEWKPVFGKKVMLHQEIERRSDPS
jgi:hypothetical protein